jgi:hypothetical protein
MLDACLVPEYTRSLWEMRFQSLLQGRIDEQFDQSEAVESVSAYDS